MWVELHDELASLHVLTASRHVGYYYFCIRSGDWQNRIDKESKKITIEQNILNLLDVWPQNMMAWINYKQLWRFCPLCTYEFKRCLNP